MKRLRKENVLASLSKGERKGFVRGRQMTCVNKAAFNRWLRCVYERWWERKCVMRSFADFSRPHPNASLMNDCGTQRRNYEQMRKWWWRNGKKIESGNFTAICFCKPFLNLTIDREFISLWKSELFRNLNFSKFEFQLSSKYVIWIWTFRSLSSV